MTKHPEGQFLHQQNPNLHHSQEVEHVAVYLRARGESLPNDPAAKLEAHLGFLANRDYVNDGILTGEQTSVDRQVEAHVIKAKEVSEGYFDTQRRIAREQGHGDIEITKSMRQQMTEAIQADQRASLGKWVEYLGTQGYPNWFKQYTFNSVTKLGNFDKEKGEFGKRSNGTTAAYPDLNREALAYVFDALQKGRIENQPPDDERLQKLLKTANFGKLYVHALKEVSPPPESLRKNIEGAWTKFDQSADPRMARRLSNSLQGHGTGWCTAGESTAAMQLEEGDFYIYYTKDEDGKDTIPRVAIRMQNGGVAEVRGINAEQELELELVDITTERLQDLEGGEEYIQKAEDMKRLTEIERKLSGSDSGIKLAIEEVKFLYELDHTIQGFGYDRDPRIDELKAKRGEQDHAVLKELAIEHIKESFEASYNGYQTIIEQLNAMRPEHAQVPILSEAELQKRYAEKLQVWQERGVLEYAAERMISHGEIHTSLMRPNIVATPQELKQLARNFAKGQGSDEAIVYDELYDQYTTTKEHELLSGYDETGEDVSISLLPSKYTAELGQKTVEQQQAILQQMSQAAPNLKLRSPSAFDALILWNTLRATRDGLRDGSIQERTAIRQLNIEPKDRDVPYVYVSEEEKQLLYVSYADDGSEARVLVG